MKINILEYPYLTYWREDNNDYFHIKGQDIFYISEEIRNTDSLGPLLALRLEHIIQTIHEQRKKK